MQYFEFFVTMLCFDGIYSSRYRFGADELLNISNENVKELDVANNNLLEIKRETFNKYQNLERLNIINSKVYFVAEKAFYDLPYLRELNLTRNLITKLNSNIFRSRSNLRKLVVSFNRLTSFDGFDVGRFSQLTFVDISNNHLRSLPPSLVEKLENETFTLIADNNFWDCRSDWSQTQRLKLCEFEPPGQPLALKIPTQARFTTCIFWIAGAFWCGVIVGNANLIRRLTCPKKSTMKIDQSTQYDAFTFYSRSDVLQLTKSSGAMKASNNMYT